MKNTKLIELLNSLSRSELRKFNDFLKSPFFNKSKNILQLHNYFKTRRQKTEKIDKHEIYKRIYPGMAYNDQKFRSLTSDYVKQIEMFFFQLNFNDDIQVDLQNLEVFSQRNCYKNFSSAYKKLKAYENNNIFPGYYDYHNLIRINSVMQILSANRMLPEKNHLDPITQTIKLFYIYSKLHFSNLNLIGTSADSKNKEFNSSFKNDFKEVKAYVHDNLPLIKERHLSVYLEFLLNNILSNYKDSNSYNELIKLFYNYHNNMTETVFYHIYFSINTRHMVSKYYTDDIRYSRQTLKFIKLSEKFGLFKKLSVMNGQMFFNSIIISIKSGDTAFSEYFYKKYYDRVDAAIKDDIICLAKARIEIEKNNMIEAINVLKTVNNTNYQIYLTCRTYLAMAYYESSYYSELEYLVDAVKHYLVRNKEKMGIRFDKYNNFFTIINKLICAKSTHSITIIKARLKKEKNINEKEWLTRVVNNFSM